MGAFSRIFVDGVEYQFKQGWDDYVTYKIGDRIEWAPDPRWPGSHIDGCHEADCYPVKAPGLWVVIKDCVVVALESRDIDPFTIAAKYGITPPPRHLWSEQAWKDKARREKLAQREYEDWLAANPGGCPASYYIHTKMREKSFAERLFPVRRVS